MVKLGDHMEIYTPEESFKMQTPESIDPGRTNPNAMFVNVKIADVGSSSPIVARTIIMGNDMLRDRLILSDDERIDEILKLMQRIKNTLLLCEQAATDLIDSINTQCVRFGETKQAANSRAYENFPVVPDLEGKVTAFLIPARRVITDVCQIPNHFWPLKRDHGSLEHLLDKELTPLLGAEHRMIQWFRPVIPHISRIIDLRNGQEHNTTTKGRRLITKNFELLASNEVHVPIWYLEDDTPQAIADEMPRTVDMLLEFAETMLVACIDANLPEFPPAFVEHIESPDPLCPVAYKLGFDMSRLQLPGNTSED